MQPIDVSETEEHRIVGWGVGADNPGQLGWGVKTVRVNELARQFVTSVDENATPKGFQSTALSMYRTVSRRDSKTQH